MNRPERRLETTVTHLSLSELMHYYKPEEIHGYCSRCPEYNKYWSCPPHSHSIPEYLKQFKRAYVLGTRVYLNGLPDSCDPIAYYHEEKKKLNSWMIDNEARFPDSTVMISGHCQICRTCTRELGKSCTFPSKQRYSLESLGFKLSDLISNCFGDSLQWKGSGVPEYLYIITGLLTVSKIEPEILNQIYKNTEGGCISPGESQVQ